MNPSDPPTPHRAAFWVAVVVGWGLIGVGVVTYADRRGTSDLVRLGEWVVGGNVVHDLVIVPVALAVAWLVARVAREPWRTPLLAGLGATACILLVSVPLLGGYGRKAGNPSLLPLDYTSAVATAVAIVWVGAAAWLGVRLVTGSVSARPRAPRRTPDAPPAP